MTSTQIESPHGTARLPQEGVAWRAVRIRRAKSEIERAWAEQGIPGSPSYREIAGGRGIEVSVELPDEDDHNVDHRLAPYEGKSRAERLESALRAFKARLEAGEVATVLGQPSGAR